MPILDQAKKAMRRDTTRRSVNDRRRRAMREQVKAFKKEIESGETDAAKTRFTKMQKSIDKAAKRGVIKSNTASRMKSRLNAFLKKASNA